MFIYDLSVLFVSSEGLFMPSSFLSGVVIMIKLDSVYRSRIRGHERCGKIKRWLNTPVAASSSSAQPHSTTSDSFLPNTSGFIILSRSSSCQFIGTPSRWNCRTTISIKRARKR